MVAEAILKRRLMPWEKDGPSQQSESCEESQPKGGCAAAMGRTIRGKDSGHFQPPP